MIESKISRRSRPAQAGRPILQGEINMQFLVYDPNLPAANAAPPSAEAMAALAKLTTEMQQAGILVTSGALPPTGTRLRRADGKFTVTDGPFIEAKELMAGFALMEANSLAEVLAYIKRFRDIIGDGESEIVP